VTNPASTASTPSTRGSIEITKRLLVIGVLALALLPPLATLAGAMLFERQELSSVARSVAWTIRHNQLDGDLRGLRSLLDTRSSDEVQWHEVLAADGSVIAEGGDERARHSDLLSAVVVTEATGVVAAVRVRESSRALWQLTVVVGLVAATLAALVWSLFVRRSFGALRKAEGRLRTLSIVDPLTGLFNRAGLRQRLQRGLDAEEGSATRRIGVLLIDLDRFRLINDSLGQQAGDRLLRTVAERIRGVLRGGDIAARLGGDQFAVGVAHLAGAQAASVMARNLLRAIEPALSVGGHQTQISASIGIALAGAESCSPDQLLAQAEAALRAAKTGGGGRHRVFEASMLVNTAKQLELEMALRRALHEEEFTLAFQPIVAADGHSTHAVEALLRWNDPARGMVSPGEFIPMLEQTGLIVPVGEWVLREACRRMRSWVAQGAMPTVLSVNVSPMQFAENDFVRQVLAVLRDTGFPADLLQLEVTEGLLLDPSPEAMRKMDALVDAGVRLAVDDFGMGYSSLAYLKSFRLHALKIDRMFVRDVPRQEQDAAIVRAIVELGHALRLHVTAEGVETAEQRQALIGLGCDSLQGFLLARPMPAEEMHARLAAESERGAAEPLARDWSTTMAASLGVMPR
jgi:diguanylate cyclase (GGDEF)-like protein